MSTESKIGLIACLLCVIVVVLVIVFWGPISTKGCLLFGYISVKSDEECCWYRVESSCKNEPSLIMEAKCIMYTETYFREHCRRGTK